MNVAELNRGQLIELKQACICQYLEDTEGRSPSWGTLAAADNIVSDDCIIDFYGGIVFTEEDFFSTCEMEEQKMQYYYLFYTNEKTGQGTADDYAKSSDAYNAIDELLASDDGKHYTVELFEVDLNDAIYRLDNDVKNDIDVDAVYDHGTLVWQCKGDA